MVSREHVENFLRINGISLTAPDEEIRSALLYARWHKKDVEYALLVLKDVESGSPSVSAGHGILATDGRLAPETLTSLLGVSVNLRESALSERLLEEQIEETGATARTLVLVTLSVFLAFVLALLIMFLLKIGPYYDPLEQSLF